MCGNFCSELKIWMPATEIASKILNLSHVKLWNFLSRNKIEGEKRNGGYWVRLKASTFNTTQQSYDSASHEQSCKQTLHTMWVDRWAMRLAHAHWTFWLKVAQARRGSTTNREDLTCQIFNWTHDWKLARMVTSRMRHNTNHGVVQLWVA